MNHYRRLYLPGGTFFFTVVTAHRIPLFSCPENVALLRLAFRYVRERRPFKIVAATVIPDHLHCLWQLPNKDHDYSTRWQMIKAHFSRHLIARKRPNRSKAIWQPRFWEYAIHDEDDLRRHLDYIHYNPVKHGLVTDPAAWKYSSIQRYIQSELYPHGWGAIEPRTIEGMNVE